MAISDPFHASCEWNIRGAMYHVMSHGDRREDIILNDVDRQDFIKTYRLMRNHYYLWRATATVLLAHGLRLCAPERPSYGLAPM